MGECGGMTSEGVDREGQDGVVWKRCDRKEEKDGPTLHDDDDDNESRVMLGVCFF